VKLRKSPPPRDANEEVSALIETLHQTGQRLEELTAGEVDSVADRDGRTFLLQRAQDRLRLVDAARQAAILNALPAHIALLDTHGLILSVNEAWRRFGSAHAIQGPGYEIGLNYLEICDSARGEGSSEAHRVAEGIRSVLGGQAKSFSIEYPCHSPTEPRWLLLTVTPLGDDRPNGAVVMHSNITERKEAEARIAYLNRVYAMLSGITTLIVRERDRDKLFRKACRIAVEEGGFRMSLLCIVDPSAGKIVPVASAGKDEELLTAIKGALSSSESAPNTLVARAIRKKEAVVSNDSQGDPRVVFGKKYAESGVRSMAILPLIVLDEAVGALALYAGEIEFFHEEEMKLLTELTSDIAFALDYIAGQQKLEKLSRIRAVSSEINAAIIHIRERKALLEETCRIVSEHGKFELIWIGAIDHDAQQVEPLAWKGFSEESARAVSWASIGNAKGTLGEAMQTRKASVRNDIEGELPGGKLRHEALKLGYQSSVCLPLVVDDRVTALVVLFAPGRGFFDKDELALLDEVASDISFALQAIEKQKKLEYLSYYDLLTGLANRTLLLERVAQYMRSATSGGHKLALALVDLERFKNINDSLGRSAGDALLKQVAEWLTRNVGDTSRLARVGADHFAVVLPEVKPDGNVAGLIDGFMTAFLEHPFCLKDAVFRLAFKMGVALFPDDGADADTLLQNAEAALKKAKASGDRYLFYVQKMTNTVAVNLTLENQLRQALDNEEFVLHYQPKVSLESGKLTGAEALIRWNDPRTGLVPPGRFIPILEETGLIFEVGRWALRKSIEDYLRWRAAGLAAVRIAVNVSPLQLRNRGFIAEIEQVIGIGANAPAGLELEITESLIMQDIKHNIASLQAIRAMGVTIAIDDFGTGFSSLAYLSKLPVDTLKIDRSFVVDMTAGAEGLALVSTIINLAHSLKLKVVAEGVETEEQSRLLRLLSCDEMQGFLFSKPVPGEIFETKFLAPVARPVGVGAD
jgi:diguanylate cyclase (GGDEF)-like protein